MRWEVLVVDAIHHTVSHAVPTGLNHESHNAMHWWRSHKAKPQLITIPRSLTYLTMSHRIHRLWLGKLSQQSSLHSAIIRWIWDPRTLQSYRYWCWVEINYRGRKKSFSNKVQNSAVAFIDLKITQLYFCKNVQKDHVASYCSLNNRGEQINQISMQWLQNLITA